MFIEAKSSENFENPFFIGTVEDNNDPTYNYRVKVRIDGVHPNTVSTSELPWAAKVDSSFMGMDGSTSLHSIPEVGSKVLLLAVGNNINSLLYLGCLYKNTASTPSGDDYTNSYGIYDKNGNYIKLDKIQQILQLVWEGKLDISIKGNIEIKTEGNVDLSAKGNVNIKSNALVSIESAPSAMTSIKGGIVQIERAEEMGFTCLNKCILTGAPHVSNVTL